jgi:transporter family-2 protein
MNSLNSRLVARVGSLATMLTVHLVGTAALVVIVAARAAVRRAGPRRDGDGTSRGQAAPRGALPLYAYLGGVVGVGTVFTSTYSYGALGASLAVALGLIGQTSFSLAVDATGAFGRRRRPLAWRRLPGIALIAAGAVCMAGNWRADLPAIVAAFFSGAFVGASSVFNSRLGQERGLLRATGTNYLTGLTTTLAIISITAPRPAEFRAAADAVFSAGPLFALGGGLMGVVAVGAMSFLFARLPAFAATILSFAGQSLCGLALDAASGIVNTGKIYGTALVVLGLGLDMALTARASRR